MTTARRRSKRVVKRARVATSRRPPAASPPTAPVVAHEGVDRSRRARPTAELSWAAFDVQVQRLAKQCARFHPDVVVGLTHGGVFVGGALASALRADFFPVRLAQRARDANRSTATRLPSDMPKALKGKRVLVVDDVAGSGDGLEMAMHLARLAGAKAVASAALISRPDGFVPDVVAFTTDVFYVFPWDYHLDNL